MSTTDRRSRLEIMLDEFIKDNILQVKTEEDMPNEKEEPLITSPNRQHS